MGSLPGRRPPPTATALLSPQELAERLAATLLYDTEHTVVPVGEHTGPSLLELMDDNYGDALDGIGLRLATRGTGRTRSRTEAGRASSAHWHRPRTATRTSAS
ncbi:hypothetical protein [Streptomyces sp. NPDC026092]|uniref:hypothetical protein n=1 Tax=Streptomyces sp. NPDC026092 TaxID=3154797 RepID=UPI0033D017CA